MEDNMKHINDDLIKLKKFIILSDVYYKRLKRGMSISNLVNQLDTEEYIYRYNKDYNDLELNNYTGFIENDEDVIDNWCALSKAAYEFNNFNETGNKIVDEYILKMKKR